jgi:quercetin dioxygenase-like cupin family protein
LDVALFDDNGNPVINLKEGDYVLLNGNTYHKVDNINIDNK